MNDQYKEPQNPSRILVVDDEEPIRAMILQGLKRKGYECRAASGGAEALDIMIENDIDVAITDISMPGMDGIELTRKIKDQFDSDVIIMTGFTQDFSYENVIDQGASDFIQKPVTIKELNLRLQRVLRERRVLAERNEAEKENAKALKQLRKAIGGTIYAMAMTIEIRDPYTAGHQRRVANLARAIARELGLSSLQIEGLCMASVIHDLGKISIPSEILSKPGRLTGIEYELIKTHPKIGYDIIKTIDFPWPLADIAVQHHERMDGTGYPWGLQSDEILPEAKILAVADVVEAMSSHRPYRPSLGVEEALEEIRSHKGKRYDSKAVDACVHVFKKKGFDF